MSMSKMRTQEPLDDILPVESPAVLRKSIDLPLKTEVILPKDILREVSLSRTTVERLCGLTAGDLDPAEPPACLFLPSLHGLCVARCAGSILPQELNRPSLPCVIVVGAAPPAIVRCCHCGVG